MGRVLIAFLICASNWIVIAEAAPAEVHLFSLDPTYALVLGEHERPDLLLGLQARFPIPGDAQLVLSVRNFHDKVIYSAPVKMQRMGGRRAFLHFSDHIGALQPGWYRVEGTLQERGEPSVKISSEVAFVVLQKASPHAADGFWGVGGLWGVVAATSRLDASTADVLQRAGIRRVRFFIDWRAMQNPDDWQPLWNQFDNMIAVCSKRGIKLLPVLVGAPDFSLISPGERGGVPSMRAWKRMVVRLVKRYGSRINQWEIWNEPNVKGFWHGTIRQYAKYLGAASKILRTHDPEATIIIGGTSGVATRWLHNLMPLVDPSAYDAVAIHSYRFPDAPVTDGVSGRGRYGSRPLAEDVQAIASFLPAGKQILITEFGMNTKHNGRRGLFTPVSLKQQADNLVKQAVIGKSSGINAGYWWLYADGFGAGLGLFSRYDQLLVPKPSLAAISTLNRYLKVDSEIRRLQTSTEGVYLFKIVRKQGASMLVAWSDRPTELTIPCSKAMKAIDIVGGHFQILGNQGQCDVPLTSSPVYLK